MTDIKERYLIDDEGRKISVVLDISDYRRILEELEELDEIRAYDRAKASSDETIPFDQAVAEIQKQRP